LAKNKKTLPKYDRDKTKNKHYEQTLIFSQVSFKKSPEMSSGACIKNKNYEQTLTLTLILDLAFVLASIVISYRFK
jgi:hypothetical protein